MQYFTRLAGVTTCGLRENRGGAKKLKLSEYGLFDAVTEI